MRTFLARRERSRRMGDSDETRGQGHPDYTLTHPPICANFAEDGHVNFVVADTKKWEQSAAYVLDTHPLVKCFVKNAGLGFAVPYIHNGEPHDYMPDFIVRLKTEPPAHLILETKGFDPLREVKAQAAARWVNAVNADGTYGVWRYALARSVDQVAAKIEEAAAPAAADR